jgi:hypothetical protein
MTKATMKMMLLILMTLASVAMAGDDNVQPDFNNWTADKLKVIFIPPVGRAIGARPTRITRVHGKIKTVTFSPGLPMGSYEFQASAGFSDVRQSGSIV